MSERDDLARDIHLAGVRSPELLAEYLVRQGWGKRRAAFSAGVASAVDAVNHVNARSVPLTPPLMRRTTR